MQINSDLLKLLQKLQKEQKNTKTFFLMPSGVLEGNFVVYNQNNDFVTLSDCILSGIPLETSITIWVGIIHGWGTK